MPHPLLKTCLKIYGINNAEVGRKLGFSRSYVQKIVNGGTYPTASGPRPRRNRRVEKAIAASLGLTHEQAWGKDSKTHLRQLIDSALNEQESINTLNQTDNQVNVNA